MTQLFVEIGSVFAQQCGGIRFCAIHADNFKLSKFCAFIFLNNSLILSLLPLSRASSRVCLTQTRRSCPRIFQAIPRNSLDFDPAIFSFWTRYKELWKFYQASSKLHQQLYLRGQFPDFPRPKIFGRSLPETISERRAAAETFLQFVVSDEVLRKTSCIMQFFEVTILAN